MLNIKNKKEGGNQVIKKIIHAFQPIDDTEAVGEVIKDERLRWFVALTNNPLVTKFNLTEIDQKVTQVVMAPGRYYVWVSSLACCDGEEEEEHIIWKCRNFGEVWELLTSLHEPYVTEQELARWACQGMEYRMWFGGVPLLVQARESINEETPDVHLNTMEKEALSILEKVRKEKENRKME